MKQLRQVIGGEIIRTEDPKVIKNKLLKEPIMIIIQLFVGEIKYGL
jgi:hypothetical protein